MILIISWFLLHVCILFFIDSRHRAVVLPVFFAALGFLFYNKPLSFDLNFYSEYFLTLDQGIFGFSVAPGFRWVTYFLARSLRFGPGAIILFWQMVILLLCVAAVRRVAPETEWYEIVIFMLLSLYYILAAHNGMRQGIALSLVFLGFVLFATGHHLWGVAYCIAALFFHRYAALFVLMVVAFTAASQISDKYVRTPSLLVVVALVFGASLAGYAMRYGGVYGDLSVNWGGYRTGTFIKAGAIGLIYFFTEWLMVKNALSKAAVLVVRLRGFVFFLMSPLVFAGEIFSRVAMFYFLVDAALMIVLLSSRQKQNMIAGGLIMLSYGIAPNAWNIISAEPRQWLGLFQL